MTPGTSYPHVTIDDQGTARLGKTRYKVLHLAAEHYHYGWTAEELLRQHPDLRPQEVYASLAYFYDHFEELVQQLRVQESQVELLRPVRSLSRTDLLRRKQGAA